MKKLSLLAVLTATLSTGAIFTPTISHAQPPGGGGGGGGRMRNNPKSRLSGLMRGIGTLEHEKNAPLSADQAKRVVTTIKPWRSRKTMTDDDAKKLYMTVNTVLTIKQKNELDKFAAKNRRFGGGGSGGAGGDRSPGGGGFGGGTPDPAKMAEMRARMAKMQGFFKTYNPFYPPSGYAELKDAPERMREGSARRYETQRQLLIALAKKGGVKL